MIGARPNGSPYLRRETNVELQATKTYIRIGDDLEPWRGVRAVVRAHGSINLEPHT
jgi:hypothetical protein